MEIFIKMFERIGEIIGGDFAIMIETYPAVLAVLGGLVVITMLGVWYAVRNN